MDVGAQSRLALASQARETSDRARDVVGATSDHLRPGERIGLARDVRRLSMHMLDLAVLTELADGTPWDVIADALGLPLDLVLDRYESFLPTWAAALESGHTGPVYGEHVIGLLTDGDPAGTAAMLDQWWKRHAEPWQDLDDGPVTRALAGA